MSDVLSPDYFYVLHVEDEPDMYGRPVRELVEDVLLGWGIPKERVEWTAAENLEAAKIELERMSANTPDYRGFDAVILDLQIPDRPGGEPDRAHGFEIADLVAKKSWCTSTIVLTQLGKDHATLADKFAQLDRMSRDRWGEPAVAEFLLKEQAVRDKGVAAKLRRCLIPLAKIAERAQQGVNWDPPSFFHGREMWCILRDLVRIADSVSDAWPLPKVLLLGEPGCGKSHLADAYRNILRYLDELEGRKPDSRPEMQDANCAGLTATDQGGRTCLFGTGERRQANFEPAPGIFEEATCYKGTMRPVKDGPSLAPKNGEPDYSRGSVVFLDEFGELDPQLQAAILTALESGKVRRAIDGTVVKIGCHVILATNSDVTGLVGTGDEIAASEGKQKRFRSDLVDRIPYVIEVPSLAQRRNEITPFLSFFGARNAGAPIEMSASTAQLVDWAVTYGWLHSVRQLQEIARVKKGEKLISDSNLDWLRRKIEMFGIPSQPLTPPDGEATLADKAARLWLPEAFRQDPKDMPEATRKAIEILYASVEAKTPADPDAYPKNEVDGEVRAHMYLLANLMEPRQRKIVFAKTDTAIRQCWTRAAERCQVKLGRSRGEADARIVAHLLGQDGV